MENWEGHAEWAFYKQKFVEWLRATLRVQEFAASTSAGLK